MKPATSGRRAERVAERIRTELMDLLLRGALRDPGASDCHVTHVAVTDDLSHARVHVRLLRQDVSEAEQKALLSALSRARGYLRRELATRLQVKSQPELTFLWDEAVDRAARIEELLSEIGREGRH